MVRPGNRPPARQAAAPRVTSHHQSHLQRRRGRSSVIDGIELYRALRARRETERLPFVFITCFDRVQALGAQMPPCLPKPFDLDRLVALVRELLSPS